MDFPGFVSHGPDVPRPRRVSTASDTLSTSSQLSKSSSPASSPLAVRPKSEDLVETLYNHPFVKIIAFTSSRYGSSTLLPSSSDTDAPPGSLPPSSRMERTIAVGAFRIYRAPGSVAFLSCGSALQPIFPKSQCWCINQDNSRFVLQIRRPQYWRIEVPVADPEDADRAVLLRDVLDKVLLFEKTECPFERSFTVHLPDPPQEPVKKKAWTAEGKKLIASRFQSDLAPPAQVPKVISRGERATSVSAREFPSLCTEPRIDDGAPKPPGLGAGAGFLGLFPLNHTLPEEANATSSIDFVPPFPPLCEADSDSIDPLEQPAVGLPNILEKITQEPTVTSESIPPSVDDEVAQDLGAQTPDSSADRKMTLLQETHAHCTELCRPTSPEAPLSIEAHQSPEPDSFEESEAVGNCNSPIRSETVKGVHLAQIPQTTPKLPSVSADATANPSDTRVPETPREICTSNQEEDSLEADCASDNDNPAPFEGSGRVAPINLTRKRMSRMLAGRSFTTIPKLSIAAFPPVKPKSQSPAKNVSSTQLPRALVEGHSPSASTDSFHSVQSWSFPATQPLASASSSRPESPQTEHIPSPTERLVLPELPSSHAIAPNSAKHAVPGSSIASGSTESNPQYTQAIFNNPPKKAVSTENALKVSRLSTFEHKVPIRRRSHASNLSISRRDLSPLPPAANLFTPPPGQTSRSRLAVVSRLPAVFVNKTVEILMSPPGHLVSLMLKVAAKIAAGEWRGLVFGFGEAGEQIPVQWDYYSDGDFSDLSDSDGYSIPEDISSLRDSVPHTDMRRKTTSADEYDHDGCEVD
ncbi:inheritance of peroxisomes protein 1-domain-containing protein [Xylaria nigripes]|nr:inheritance of peroxisomes protein 1-domain-containing protein [Xylaria nigripes]